MHALTLKKQESLYTHRVIGKVVKFFDHNLFENVQVRNQNKRSLANVHPGIQ